MINDHRAALPRPTCRFGFIRAAAAQAGASYPRLGLARPTVWSVCPLQVEPSRAEPRRAGPPPEPLRR